MSRVPDVFRPGTLASLRPGVIQHYVEQQQRQLPTTTTEPQLLQRLYACLDEAAITEALRPNTDLQVTANQRTLQELNAYHRVFDLLLASLTTYQPLLLRIKLAYDDAFKDAVAAACDNAYLRSRLSLVPHKQAEAAAGTRQAAEQAADAMEEELQQKLAALEEHTQQVEREGQDVEQQLQYMHKHMLQARRELDQLDAFCRRAHKELLDSTSWGVLGIAREQASQPGV